MTLMQVSDAMEYGIEQDDLGVLKGASNCCYDLGAILSFDVMFWACTRERWPRGMDLPNGFFLLFWAITKWAENIPKGSPQNP